MPLPKIKHPIYDFTIPSTGVKISFRPFLVKEEKLLLMAKESAEPIDSIRAVKQVVNNCAVVDLDVDQLTMFDLEYLFLQLRAVSVGGIITLSFIDNEDKQQYDFEVDLKQVSVRFPEDVSPLIHIADDVHVKMKWPSAKIMEDNEFLASGSDLYYELILRCMDTIIAGDSLYPCVDTSNKELEEFLDSISVEAFDKIQTFVASTPRLYHKLEYKNANGNDRKIELTSLTDFFTVR